MATIEISDDTTTVTLTSGDYGVTAWSPRVPRRRRGELGGRGPYADVLEEINVFMQDTTSAAFLGNINAIRDLLDQAERWAKGEDVDCVKIKYTPTSGGTEYQSPIVAVPEDAVVWPEEFALAANITFSIEFTVRFWRAGVWLVASEQRTVSTSTSNNPGVMSISTSFTDSPVIPSPYDIQFDWDQATGHTDMRSALLFAKSSSFLRLLEGESGSGTEYSSVADSDASGGNVGRRTPTTTNITNITWSFSAFDSSVESIAMVVNLKNRSSSVSYKLRARAGTVGEWSRYQTIDTTDNTPQLVVFGPLRERFSSSISNIAIEITPDGTGTGSGDGLDIDAIGVCAIDNDVGRIIIVDEVAQATADPVIEHATLTDPAPLVYRSNVGTVYTGNPYLVSTGNDLAVLLLGNTGTADKWRIRESGADALLALGITVDRNTAYLVPE